MSHIEQVRFITPSAFLPSVIGHFQFKNSLLFSYNLDYLLGLYYTSLILFLIIFCLFFLLLASISVVLLFTGTTNQFL